jgi:hypothetical protein
MRINEIFLTEDDGDKHMTFCFGRFNPPTLGHKQVFKAMQKTGGEMEIYTSQTQDAKKNPLDYSTKVSFIRNIHREFANNVVENTDMNTLPKICTSLHERGFNHITFVAGSDRLDMMSKLIKDYNGVEGKGHGYYKFETMNFNSSGQREDGSDGVEGISGTMARADAANGDINKFAQHTGAGEHADELYAAVRKGMGINDNTGENDE